MFKLSESTGLADKLTEPMAAVIEKHRSELAPMLAGKAGELSRSALANDDNVRKVATFAYAVLPGLVRLAVKEPVFVDFVLTHRHTVLDKLVSQTEKALPS
jgi:hypothetical protein